MPLPVAELRELYAVVSRPPSESEDTGGRIDVDGWYTSIGEAVNNAKRFILEDEDHHDTLIMRVVAVVQWPELPAPTVRFLEKDPR